MGRMNEEGLRVMREIVRKEMRENKRMRRKERKSEPSKNEFPILIACTNFQPRED